MKGQSVQKIHLDMNEVLENDLLNKQQLQVDSCFTAWSALDWR